jgi:hypothetical protein
MAICNHPKNKEGVHRLACDENGGRHCFYCGTDYVPGWNDNACCEICGKSGRADVNMAELFSGEGANLLFIGVRNCKSVSVCQGCRDKHDIRFNQVARVLKLKKGVSQ